GLAMANLYTAMEGEASSYTDTATANNSVFLGENPFRFRQEMARLDYNINANHRLTARLVLDHYDLIAPYGTFIDSQLPTIPTNRQRPGRNVQVNHNWNVKPNLMNEIKFNYSGNGQVIPPVGDAWKRETYGFQFPQLYQGGGDYDNSIPGVDITGYATFRGAAASLLSPTKDWALMDTVTWLSGNHTVKGGVLGVRNFKDQNGRPNYPGFINFSPSGNPNSTGNAFADSLLGNFREYSENQSDPIGNFRFWQFEAFVTDAWRVSSDLNVEVGLRYAYHSPTITKANNVASFDQARYDPAQAVVMNTNGTIVPGSGNRYNGLTKPGDIPSGEEGNVANANDPAVKNLPIADHRGFYAGQHQLMPRFSFAWTPGGSGKTAVRGGVGLFYDRPEGNLYFSLVNTAPFSLSSSFQNGNLANPGGGTAAAITPWAQMDALDPGLVMPRTWNWSLSVQRELGIWGLFGEVAYVGADGQNLLRQPDINQPSFADLEANAAGPRYSTNYLRPYRGFSAIRMRLSDADSSYQALQVFLSKRRGNLMFTLNYTLSRAYDNGSGNGDNAEDYENKDYNWGPSDFDRTHIFVATWSYRLPFFRDERGVLGQVLGGWEFSGITRYQTGSPLTISANTSIGGRRADYLGGDPYVDERINPTSGAVQWLNPAAFAAAPEGRRGNSERGQFRGPSYHVWDISLRKQFVVSGDVRLQVQADLFNAWNVVSWGNPQTNLSASGPGNITSANPPRNIQLGIRLTF
ncbi:MAG TPA: carboxypeptidase regulatory-like domain-containing protein, partial [Vicinamibacteria bacterium]|nr:carboxypeptidase regulatory-like domain-containing protein [Vicinamibacteria bacterium]